MITETQTPAVTRPDAQTPTFAETQGQPPFDWNAHIQRGLAGLVSDDEWALSYISARKWVTCACGNQCASIPRYKDGDDFSGPGRPADWVLNYLGGRFYGAIMDRDYTNAKRILTTIERRSAEILREMAVQS